MVLPMAYFNSKFKKARLDQSPYLFHFINGDDSSPHETLRKILEDKRLISRKGYICFSASPLTTIIRFFEVEVKSTGRPMYQPWGLGFSRDRLVRDFGARNVIYTDGAEEIPMHLWWRTQKLDVDSYDFEYLREWRIKGGRFDFSEFPKCDMIVIAPNFDALNDLVVRFDMKFTPYVNHFTEYIEESWNEVWERGWRGISVDRLGTNILNDYTILSITTTQVLEEDMLDELLAPASLSVLIPNKKMRNID